MDIRKFMSRKTSAATPPSRKSPRKKVSSVSPAKPDSRTRRTRTVVVVDSDEDDDVAGEPAPRTRPQSRAKPATAKRSAHGLEKSKPIALDDDDDEDDDGGDTAMAPKSSRRRQPTGTGAKRGRAEPDDLEPHVAPRTHAKGSGFGGADEEPDDAPEPDAKKPKRAAQIAAFNKFKNRGGPPNAGKKDLPVGAKDCLHGNVFVITGVLDSLEREECTELIKEYGGRVVSGVSKKVTHGIVGTEPGDSKMKKLKELKTAIIDEDGLFAMIARTAPKDKVPKAKTVVEDSDSDMLAPASEAGGKPDRMELDQPARGRRHGRPAAPGSGASVRNDAALWVDKYRPVSVDELVANPGIYKQIASWLTSWKSKHLSGDQKPGRRKGSSSSGKDDDRPALLLCGPPGIGKTTAAHAICRACGFEPHEFNASDVRNKAGVQALANSIMLGASMSKFFSSSSSTPSKSPFLSTSGNSKKSTVGSETSYRNGQVLIMDEVDGMSGGDRGGSQELMRMFKLSRVPIICICNDDSSQKMRTLANHCFKLKFRRPMASQVRERLLFIAKREGFRAIDSQTAERLATGCHGDIRQMINMLQTWRLSSSSLSYQDVKQRLDVEGKTFETMSTFDLAQSYFAMSSPSNTLIDRMENFFLDSDLMPLFVEENYLLTSAARGNLSTVADAAESISDGDICNGLVRGVQRWDLMPAMSVLSTVLPGALLSGGLSGQRLMFPSALGNMSKTSKQKRIARELEMRVKVVGTSSGSARAFRLDYLPTMTVCMATPLIQGGAAAIPDVIERLDAYYLQKDDWTAIMELGVYKEKRGPLDAIPGPVKSSLTREYNKVDHAASTVTEARIGAKGKQDGGDAVVRRKMASAVADVAVVDEDVPSDDDGGESPDSDIELDQFKVKGRGKASSGVTTAKRGRGSVRGGRGGRGNAGRSTRR